MPSCDSLDGVGGYMNQFGKSTAEYAPNYEIG